MFIPASHRYYFDYFLNFYYSLTLIYYIIIRIINLFDIIMKFK